MKLKLLLLIFFPSLIFPQLNIHKDTSFTTYSAYEKEAKNYPFIKIAVPELNEGITSKRKYYL